jgi:ferredoxin
MKISVDRDLCESHGQCEFVAEKVFRMDDDGVIHFREEVPEEQREEVELAAQVCPTLAITVSG